MKLAGLSDRIKAAYREGRIDTGTAEAFTVIPVQQQNDLWQEIGGKPRDAEQVRGHIESRWIDASLALFPVDSLPAEAVSTDLFRQGTGT
jgi:hypothetical protein